MANHAYVPAATAPKQVETMAGYGIAEDDIATVLGITAKTLRKYHRGDLDRGIALAKVNIGKSIYDQAVGRPAVYDEKGNLIREELKPDKSAAIFLSKVRLGMKETVAHEHTGRGGRPIESTNVPYDLSALTDEEFALFQQLHDKAKARRTAGTAGDPGAG